MPGTALAVLTPTPLNGDRPKDSASLSDSMQCMARGSGREWRYDTTLINVGKRVYVPVPFHPNEVWGSKPRHHVRGTVNGMGIRGVVEPVVDGVGVVLGPAWRRDCGLASGDAVSVVLEPEGPQRDDLPDDVRNALAANPAAAEFFDSLAQFYRNSYLRWIESTKRRPDVRAERLAQVIDWLSEGVKERPST